MMSKPTGATLSMLVFLAAVAAVVAVLREPLAAAFFANPVFNGVIVGVFAVGVLVNFRQALSLAREVAWIEEFRREGAAGAGSRAPRLLAPMAHMLAQKDGKRLSLSALSMRALLDGIRSRLEEARDVGRYMSGLLIFLGLLGTFWGLLTTIGAVNEVIGGLALQGGDPVNVFETLKLGLRRPLSGMGTAFSTSLFGLSGALVLGFLDLQTGHAQNRFFNELEEWLAGLTRLASGALPGDAEGGITAYVQALLEQTADSLDWLRRTLADNEQERRSTNDRLVNLSDQLARLTDQMRAEVGMLQTLAESHQELKPVLRRLADSSAGLDEASRAHLRNLDVGLARMHEETRTAADRFLQEFRNEIRLLSRTVAASASGHSLPADRLE
jgi:hypothetical protein